jgi:Na+-driven multidrug efflux pump
MLGLGPAPKLGIAGAAVAGVIANAICLGLMVRYIYWRNLPLMLSGAELRYLLPARALVAEIIRKGAPAGLQMILIAAGSLATIGLINGEGTRTAAAYGAINQLWTYIQMPAIAIGMGVSTMVAHNIGADRWERVNKIAMAGLALSVAITATMVAVVALADRLVLGLFLGGDAETLAVAQHVNLLSSWSFILTGVMMVLSAAPRANGATVPPLLIVIFSLFVGRLGAACLLLPRIGSDGIWWSFPIGAAISVALSAAYYRYGGWRGLQPFRPAPAGDLQGPVEDKTPP